MKSSTLPLIEVRAAGRPMSVLLAAALATTAMVSPSAAQEKTVTFWKAPHSSQEEALWQPLIAEFEAAHPGVKIQHVVTPWDTWQEQYFAAFSSATPPCVSYMVDWFSPAFVYGDKFVNLNDAGYGDQVKEGYGANWRAAEFGGMQVGIPFASAPRMWMYNKDLFDQAGVAYPTDDWTLDQFGETLHALRDGGVSTPAVVPVANGGFQTYLPFLWANGGNLLSDDGKQAVIDTPEGLETLNFIKGLFDDGVVASLGEYTDVSGSDLFVRGGTALSNNAAQYLGTIRTEAPDLNYGLVLPPKGASGDQPNFQDWGYFALSKDCPALEEAWEFMKFITSKDATEAYIGAVGLYPARVDTNLFEGQADEQKFLASMPLNRNVPIVPKSREVIDSWFTEIEAALVGQITTEEALQNAQSSVSALLN